ncbi:putative RNA helicase [Medicago truncatula]|uniref:RNA helicase n=1 Tax=Medicago truncatula TaxID=3880 RepID=G7JUZ3_MEDTR|nr:putative DEAD-box ATP-dependent RNA helicase 29 isoform X2 [Medicago truncatula]AES89733.1 DEAD-box ATP-dependent RNA helicase [Medicago truncatula]RHN61820.1 putative RNA helicase [Medicago truncatula]
MGGFPVGSKKKKNNKNQHGFETLGLNRDVFSGIKRKGYKVPTPIQRKTMPLILSGIDVVAMARTGSGKTAAFLVPMLHRLNQHVPQGGVRGLILSPTRDLAQQTLKFTKELGHFTDLRVSLLVGGDSMESQFEELAQNPDIIIATPGRLMHHLSEVDDMSLRKVEYVVFDEADCLFGMGFAEQLHQILAQLGENRQTLLFSATLPSALAEFAKAGLRDPRLVRLDLETKISPDLKLVFFTLRQEEKYAALLYLIRELIGSDEQTLIFVSTKHHVEFLNSLFQLEGIRPSVCYGDMDQDARKEHVARFRSRKTMLLIVTDIAARGIDIPLLDNVINWDFPPKPKIFVHRVGRVARAGRTGTAYSFLTAEDMAYLLDLHLFLSKPVKAAPTEEEVLRDMDGVMSRIDDEMLNGETIYGRFPQKVIDLVSDRVREVIDTSAELEALQRACKNAFRLYSKTKPLPSKESIRRVKDLPHEGLHPIFNKVLGTGELTAIAFSEHLKNFRPKQTILEAEGEAAKAKRRAGPSGHWVDVMKRKRAVHDSIIVNEQHSKSNEHQSKSNSEKEENQPEITSSMDKGRKARGSKRKPNPESFKDEEYFISSIPQNQHMEAGLAVKANEGFSSNRLDDAVLDLGADDGAGIKKQKSVYHWDKRSKKYIKLNNGDRVAANGKIKTESGAKTKANKTGIYKKWKERSHSKISLKGTSADGDAQESRSSRGSYQGGGRNYKGGKKQHLMPNAHVRSEIKDMDQIRKERQKKASKISYMKSKSPKGKKSGKPGRKGGNKRKSK